jgi:3-hydroxymyristoyl/3-hydroxydecanoyl-(acyl carrier protein) dehydratase
VLCQDDPVYTGDTYFGFFTLKALSDQRGLSPSDECPKGDLEISKVPENEGVLDLTAPLTPDQCPDYGDLNIRGLALPAKALLMLDRITAVVPYNRSQGKGYIRAEKKVDPNEWFFKAHFYQDPVCPGSLGIESFLQLLKIYAKRKWQDLSDTHRFEILPQINHRWTYRGQIIPANHLVTIEAIIKQEEEKPDPMIIADGWVTVDDLPIYKMENFGLRLVPLR